MSRLLTLSELYSLLLNQTESDKSDKLVDVKNHEKHEALQPMMLNHQSPILWLNPTRSITPPTPPPPKARRQVPITSRTFTSMGEVARASGISERDAWEEAAQLWIAQRRRDMEDLATADGQELSCAVKHIWSVIDDQLRELRAVAG